MLAIAVLVQIGSASNRLASCLATCVSGSATCIGACMFAGPAAPFCMAACGAACVACEAQCADNHPARCFLDNVTVHVVEQGHEDLLRKVQDVETGEMVFTMVNGKSEPTEVLWNRRVAGTSDFLTFVVVAASGRSMEISVTDNHNLLVFRDGTTRVVQARDVHLGEVMRGAAARDISKMSHSFENVTIKAIRLAQHGYRNELITRHGTVMANGVHVTTICDDAYYARFADSESALKDWRRAHRTNATTPFR